MGTIISTDIAFDRSEVYYKLLIGFTKLYKIVSLAERVTFSIFLSNKIVNKNKFSFEPIVITLYQTMF